MGALDFQPRNSGKSGSRLLKFLLIIGIISAVGFGSTLASNISLNSGHAVEFGQGISQIVGCAGNDFVTVTPKSEFINSSGNSTFKLQKISLSHIPASCWGKSFNFEARGQDGGQLLLNAQATSVAATYFGPDSTSADGNISNATGENTQGSYGAFDLSIANPAADTTTIYKIILQSGEGTIPNLVAYWNFNNASALGTSTYGNLNLKSCGNPASGTGLDGSSGLLLDGVSYLASSSAPYVRTPCSLTDSVPTPSVLLGNATYSMTAWFKSSGGNSTGGIMAWGVPGCGQTTDLRFAGFDTFAIYWWNCDIVATVPYGVRFDDSRWHFVASTYDGSDRKLYFDGSLIGSDSPPTPDFQQSQFLIGATIYDQPFVGTLDNVGVYSSALSDRAIADLFNRHG